MKKTVVRILAAVMAAVMLLGIGAQLFSLIGYAVTSKLDGLKVSDKNGSSITYIRPYDVSGTPYTLSFYYAEEENLSALAGKKLYYRYSFFTTSDNWARTSSTQLVLTVASQASANGTWRVDAELTNLRYNSTKKDNTLEFNATANPSATAGGDSDSSLNYQPYFKDLIDITYFQPGSTGSSSSGEDEYTYASDILVESVRAYDQNNKEITAITKDTEPFSVEIIYSDYGLIQVDPDDIYTKNLEAYATDLGGFASTSGSNRGSLTKITTLSAMDAPRFRVRFGNLTYKEGGGTLSFQVHYDILGELVVGKSSARVSQVTSKEEEEEEDELPPPTPYIIVSQYSYGGGSITAGDSFSLSVSYQNTSVDIPLENIIMTVTTPDDLSIASASNTVYVKNLVEGASQSHTVELQARPNAGVGSKSVQIEFSYQYIWDKQRMDGKTSETIAIPITQIDRFSLDPITEISDYAMLGEQFYVTIGFTNKGKSPTYNITASARSNFDLLAVPEHYGNLEAGKSDTVDVYITPNEAGDLVGEIVVQYEDENASQKELSMPFTIYVNAPYNPAEEGYDPGPYPGDMMPEEPQQNNTALVLYITGSGLIAAAMAYYIAKRVKSKESDDFDEDF